MSLKIMPRYFTLAGVEVMTENEEQLAKFAFANATMVYDLHAVS